VQRLPRQSSIAHGLPIEPMFNTSGIISPIPTPEFSFNWFSAPGQMSGVNVSLVNETTIFLDEQCTRLLMYPYQMCVYNL
jgi:hypothetical protein